MTQENNYTDIFKSFGKQDYVIYKRDYRERIKENPLVNGLWTVGKWFSFVANTHTWELEFVGGDSESLIGYTPEEILKRNAQFVASFIFQEDYAFVNQVIHLAMKYVNELPVKERLYVYVVFYARSLSKDGKVITIQNQNIPLVFAEQNLPFIFANIITDISHIHHTNIPQAVLVNKLADKRFHLNPQHLQLKPHESLFTEREREIVSLLIKGLSSRKISEVLNISYETARTHRKNILQKASVRNTSQLVSYVLLNKVV